MTTPAYDALTTLIYDLLDYKREEDSIYIARKLMGIRDMMIVESEESEDYG